jgi:hypothetical protein
MFFLQKKILVIVGLIKVFISKFAEIFKITWKKTFKNYKFVCKFLPIQIEIRIFRQYYSFENCSYK